MLKLYQHSESVPLYWETWEDSAGRPVIHWGELGTRGEFRTVEAVTSGTAHAIVQEEIHALISGGFKPLPLEDHAVLMIEYGVDGMGSETDVAKRHRLEERMNETLGWTGLGHCDGGSIGSGSMEVCCFVVDFEIAKRIIELDLAGTDFGDYSRIYQEPS